jgi:hypothetical protein
MATQVAVNTNVEESIALARGRQSLDRSVWYNGWLMTFLATAEDTQGKFALIEASPDEVMFHLRTFVIGRRKPSTCWRAR